MFEIAVPESEFQPIVRSEYASFWRRLVAWLADGFVVQTISGIISTAAAGFGLFDYPIIDVLYPVGFIAFGATPGMHMLGIRVVDKHRKDPGFVRSIRRFILPALWLVPWFIFWGGPAWFFDLQVTVYLVFGLTLVAVGFLDPLWMIWDERKQTLHDKLAGTYVIRD